MAQLGFYIDLKKCIGCATCQIACKDKNNLVPGVSYRLVSTYEVGTYPNARAFHYPFGCNHCANPACVEICPVEAMHKDAETGLVLFDDEKCIGCKSCMEACPYSIPQFVEADGVVRKCDGCKEQVDRGQNPICIDACRTRALMFGDLEELKARYGSDLVDEIPILPSAATTSPSLLIRPSGASLETGSVEVKM